MAIGAYAYWSTTKQAAPAVATTTSSSDTSGTPVTTAPSGTTSGTAAQYKDGTYTGSVANATPYGQIQVEAIISGGQISDIQFLKYPDAPGHTSDVSAATLPQLKAEAITAQSAKVDIVSGATQDSQAFQQSLGVALAMATQS